MSAALKIVALTAATTHRKTRFSACSSDSQTYLASCEKLLRSKTSGSRTWCQKLPLSKKRTKSSRMSSRPKVSYRVKFKTWQKRISVSSHCCHTSRLVTCTRWTRSVLRLHLWWKLWRFWSLKALLTWIRPRYLHHRKQSMMRYRLWTLLITALFAWTYRSKRWRRKAWQDFSVSLYCSSSRRVQASQAASRCKTVSLDWELHSQQGVMLHQTKERDKAQQARTRIKTAIS